MKIKNLEECETLAGEILRNIELSEIPINNVILKGLRLCRLMGDEQGIDFFSYEALDILEIIKDILLQEHGKYVN